jgi:hypothetical protein
VHPRNGCATGAIGIACSDRIGRCQFFAFGQWLTAAQWFAARIVGRQPFART